MNHIEKNFQKYDAENPHVWELFKKFAFEMASKSWKLSASLITERIRWELNVVTKTDEPWKINNNYRAYYARKFDQEYPYLSGRFELRRTRA